MREIQQFSLSKIRLEQNDLKNAKSTKYLGQEKVAELSDLIKEQTQLRDLNLIMNYNNMEDTGAIKLGQSLSNLKDLQNLNLQLRQILVQRNLVFKQKQIILRGNQIGNSGAVGLAEGFNELKNLQKLNFNIVQKSFITFKILRQYRPFNYLDKNEIQQEQYFILLQSLSKMTRLTDVKIVLQYELQIQNHLQFNQLNKREIKSEGCKFLCQALQKCNLLQFLNVDLVFNGIDQIGAAYIGQMLTQLHQLKNLELNLFFNPIAKQGMEHLLVGLSECKDLEYLSLNLSNTGEKGEEGGIILAKYLNLLGKLKTLSLLISSSFIRDKGYEALQGAFLNLKCLNKLYLGLDNNQINQNKKSNILQRFKRKSTKLIKFDLYI
ncbi:hypothetical protein ABPG72_013891 [Tetrahymena utriculariae]